MFLISHGCRESELLEQIASDYFPVHRNYIWYYAVCGDTIEMVGGKEYKIAGRDAYLLKVGIDEEFYYKGAGISQLFWHRIAVGDKEETLFIWIPYLPEYLVVGDEWYVDYVLNDTVFGDEIRFSVKTHGKIVSRSGDICEVERVTLVSFESSQFATKDTIDAHLWYKRDVGLERAIINDKEYRLIYYIQGG